MQLKRLSNGQLITLGSEIARGGEGIIYRVLQDPTIVAKIYLPDKITVDQVSKLRAMLANPPSDSTRGQGHTSIAWCIDLITPASGGQPVGFLMMKATGMSPIFNFYNPKSRREQAPLFNYLYLHRAARNLASAVLTVHDCGYVIGDVNESNILLTDTALVTLVDTDSFQVGDGQTLYRCPVGKPEFTPPELQGKPYKDVDRTSEHDLFGLAVIIFNLLMEGNHPFAGEFTGQGEVPPIEARIQAGHFLYGVKIVPYRPKPLAPAFAVLHPSLRQLFQRCFEMGHINPSARPTAKDWQNALDEAERALIACSQNEQHRYGNYLTACPWCKRTQLLEGRDPFPSVEAVRLGNNLQSKQPLPQVVTSQKSLPSPSAQSRSQPKAGAAKTQPQKTSSSRAVRSKQFKSVKRFFMIGIVFCAVILPIYLFTYFRYGYFTLDFITAEQRNNVRIGAKLHQDVDSSSLIDGPIYVEDVISGTPASKAGITPGDTILRVNGISTYDQPVCSIVRSLRGREGTYVTISVRRQTGFVGFKVKRERTPWSDQQYFEKDQC